MIKKSKMTSNIVNNKYIYIFLAIICSLIIFRDVMHFSVSKFIFVFLYCLLFVFIDTKNIIAVLSFTIPFLNGLPGNWILLIAICALVFKKDFHFNSKKIYIPLIIILAESLHSFQYYDSGILDIVRYGTYIIIICFIVFDDYVEIDYQKCLILFALGVIFMCTIIFLTTLEYYPIKTVLSGDFRYGNLSNTNISQDMFLSNNQNNIGYYCSLGLTVLIILNSHSNQKLFFNFTLIPFIVFFGLLTMSRAFILTTLGIIILFYVFNLRKNVRSFINSTGVLILFIVLFLFINQLIPEVIESIGYRFEEQDITNGRSTILELFNKFLYNNIGYFIFGTGLVGINEVSGIHGVPHNGFQQVFIAYGVIGFIVFLFIATLVINSAKKYKGNLSPVAYLPIICMMIYIQSIQLLYPFELMLPIIISFFSIRLYSLQNQGDKDE